MKKGFWICFFAMLVIIAGLLAVDTVRGGIWILEGLNGKDGKSAYELAVEAGFTGTEQEWLASLAQKGAQGEAGRDGADGADGVNGKNGTDGVGIRDVRFNEKGELLVTLTNGVVINAGRAPSTDDGYVYTGEIPEVHLPENIILTQDARTWFSVEEMVPYLSEHMTVDFTYDGLAECTRDDVSFGVKPTAAGNARLTLRIKYEDAGTLHTIAEHVCSVRVVVPDKTLNKTGILIGDSRISDGSIPDGLKNDLPSLNLIGTIVNSYGDHTPHEGRAAWSTDHYFKNETYCGRTNAFYNPATATFDFSYYMQTNFPDQIPDFVVINLGANDGFSEKSVGNIGKMVDSIRKYGSEKGRTIQILVMTEYLSPLTRLDASAVQKTEAELRAIREKQFRYYTYLKNAFAGREAEGIYLVPNFVSINFWSDRVRSSGEASAITDAIHLGANGYLKEYRMLESYLYALFGK